MSRFNHLHRLLDAEQGGFWSIGPTGAHEIARGYLDGTNILRTAFTAATGRVAVTDFMPVGRQLGAGTHEYVSLTVPRWLVRRIEGLAGEVEVAVRYRSAVAFARRPAALTLGAGRVCGEGVPDLYADLPFAVEGDLARATLSIRAGERRDLVLAANAVAGEDPRERVDEFRAVTAASWREWLAYCRYDGPHHERVRRSALALKLLTYAPTGALVAAPTTSLPEALDGARNWDYRYSWLRASCFTLYALAVLGYSGEARCYHDYLARCVRETLPITTATSRRVADGRRQVGQAPGRPSVGRSRPLRPKAAPPATAGWSRSSSAGRGCCCRCCWSRTDRGHRCRR